MIAGLLLGVGPISAWAWPPTFGVELEFTNEAVIKATDRDGDPTSHLRKIIRKYREHCRRSGRCTAVLDQGELLDVTTADGLKFKVAVDEGTLEIKLGPMTSNEFERHRKSIQANVFDFVSSQGFFPQTWDGGAGHVHVGLQSILEGNDPALVRDFIVDFLNHHEIAHGVLEFDPLNALPVTLWSDEGHRRLKSAIASFDRGKTDLAGLLETLNSLNREFSLPEIEKPLRERYAALNVWRALFDPQGGVGPDRTLEVRSLRMYRNADDLTKILKLFEARLGMLAKRKSRVRPGKWTEHDTDIGKAEAFRRYVEEAGLRYSDYVDMLDPDHRLMSLTARKARCVRSRLLSSP